MSCHNPCHIQGKTYTFSTSPKIFLLAERECKKSGGTVAKVLDETIYAKLKSCCNSQQQFWIGLKNTPGLCPTSREYQWISDSTCINPTPLVISPQPNNRLCQAVTIQMIPNQGLPLARETDCTSQYSYICQYSTKSKPTAELPTTTLNPKKGAIAFPSDENISESTFNIGAIVGGTAAFLCLILLILILFHHFRKSSQQKTKDNVQTPPPYPQTTVAVRRHSSRKSYHIYFT